MNSINPWICRNLDSEKKGYVTLGNFLDYVFLLGFVSIVLYSAYIFISKGSYWAFGKETHIFFLLGGIMVTLLIILLSVYFLASIWAIMEYLSDIKITRCELKEEIKKE